MTTPSLHDEMQAVIANLEAREWTQGYMERDGAVCAHGAVMTCQGLRPGDAEIIRAVMRRRGLTEGWNDGAGRTKDQVLERLRSIGVSDADLEATFGASWRLVVALIRRAAVLTDDEAARMAAAREAAREACGAAWYAACEAVGNAAWEACGAVGNAAWEAAGNAAREACEAAGNAAREACGAAWHAAREAAWACVTADLIGQHGYTQAHHDMLMQPWISALGDGWADVVA